MPRALLTFGMKQEAFACAAMASFKKTGRLPLRMGSWKDYNYIAHHHECNTYKCTDAARESH